MNRGPSPIFDVPEFPTLRRVKPLPKRRRTAEATPPDADDPVAALGLPFPLPGPDATARSSSPTQSPYIFGGTNGSSVSHPGLNLGGYGGEDDGEDGDDDGMERLTQPGNTKKRKPGDPPSGGEDEPAERGIPTGRGDDAADNVYQPPPSSPFSGLGLRRGRPPRITLAGLQHKETLKSRKRQLAAVLGALSHGDTLALDQALSSNYPFVGAGPENVAPLRVRISRRLGPRLARAARFSEKYRHPDKRAFSECAFTFACPSSRRGGDVARAVRGGACTAGGKGREARGGKQAHGGPPHHEIDPAETRRAHANPARTTHSSTTTTTTTTTTTASHTTDGAMDAADQAALMGLNLKPRSSGSGKKKKRSALANASNPHHLRNYVPSRLPHSTPPRPPPRTQQQLPPAAVLVCGYPPRRRGRKGANGNANGNANGAPADGGPVLTNPADEWICAFCEYELFYGDDAQHRRAVRSRKKILRRRRRARERAAAAASGTGVTKKQHEERKREGEEEYEMHPGYAPGVPDGLADVPKVGKWRGAPDKERERAGELGAVG
ncbi:hypothetical protein B0H13DRAFT_2408432 [Mycena leptocephala]|nr:hypothetical protein B0H13DRAFT_2408432 [Mycena leptocephala]